MDLNSVDPANYEIQLSEKLSKIKVQFNPFYQRDFEVYKSEPLHYRMRAEFRVWHEGEDLYCYIFDKHQNKKIRTDQFAPASQLINKMMLVLFNFLQSNQILRHKLFQVDFLSTKSGEILVTLIYHRQLNDEWIKEAHQLKEKLSLDFKVNLIGRAKKQMIEIDQGFVIEELVVDQKKLYYKQIENSFTQPNAGVATSMLAWAKDVTKNSTGDLLELYCGNGNFSIALASNFRKVLATELAKPSVEAAQYNIKANDVNNLQIIRMSAEDFSDAMKGVREFNRLKGIDLSSYECNTILVDPPRAGLDSNTLDLVKKYDRILYISCNPNTLSDNLKTLIQTHQLKRFAVFDQFPYTDHIECGVWLEKNSHP